MKIEHVVYVVVITVCVTFVGTFVFGTYFFEWELRGFAQEHLKNQVPIVVGLEEEEAIEILEQRGITKLTIVYEPSFFPEGKVLRQYIPIGKEWIGESPMVIVVSDRPPPKSFEEKRYLQMRFEEDQKEGLKET